MKASHADLIATPQFDSGRWKLRLEYVPFSTDKQSDNEHNSCEIDPDSPNFVQRSERNFALREMSLLEKLEKEKENQHFR
jgi:hypothetical protein